MIRGKEGSKSARGRRALLALPAVLVVSIAACPEPNPNRLPDGGCAVSGNCDCGTACACSGGFCILQAVDGGDGGFCECEAV